MLIDSNYQASVIQISNLEKHPYADRLQLTTINGCQVITGLETKIGDWYIYFPTDGQLNPSFLLSNKLYRKDPKTGTKWPGFFDEKGRVKPLTILNIKSDGFIFPLEKFNLWLDDNCYERLVAKEQDFSSVKSDYGKVEICWKYFNEETLKEIQKQKRNPKAPKQSKNIFFKKHTDTDHFWKWIKSYKEEFLDHFIVTEKAHGTSGRLAYLRENITINKYLLAVINTLLSFLKLPLYKPYKYSYYLGSRNTTLSISDDTSRDNYRQKVIRPLLGKLLPGETLYFEIVGYKDNGKPLFWHNIEKTKNKELIDKFGKKVDYSYGCSNVDKNKPLNKIIVYRITHTNEDSKIVRELSWKEVEKRCEALNIEAARVLLIFSISSITILNDIKQFEEVHCDFDVIESSYDNHPKEGVCLRLERTDGTIKITKIKTFWFKLLESIIKEDSSVVDEEEIS